MKQLQRPTIIPGCGVKVLDGDERGREGTVQFTYMTGAVAKVRCGSGSPREIEVPTSQLERID